MSREKILGEESRKGEGGKGLDVRSCLVSMGRLEGNMWQRESQV